MPEQASQMALEIAQIPDAVDRLLAEGAEETRRVAREALAASPNYLVTVGRGSSDHACSFLKYACELLIGLPVASVGPSVASIYHAPLTLTNGLCLAVSQSGQSPDIVELTRTARQGGAYTIAITNESASPLAKAADGLLDLHAGPEVSVAATKTFVTSLVAGLRLLAEIKQDANLLSALHSLPGTLERARGCDWSAFGATLQGGSLFTLGRGPTSAISDEAALKFKETSRLHAESYSSAEVLHGPVSIVDRGFPVLAFAASDAAEEAIVEVCDTLQDMGAEVFVTSDKARKAGSLAHIRTGHWLTDPIALIVSFYAMAEAIAAARGLDVDKPRHLRKVTETV